MPRVNKWNGSGNAHVTPPQVRDSKLFQANWLNRAFAEFDKPLHFHGMNPSTVIIDDITASDLAEMEIRMNHTPLEGEFIPGPFSHEPNRDDFGWHASLKPDHPEFKAAVGIVVIAILSSVGSEEVASPGAEGSGGMVQVFNFRTKKHITKTLTSMHERSEKIRELGNHMLDARADAPTPVQMLVAIGLLLTVLRNKDSLAHEEAKKLFGDEAGRSLLEEAAKERSELAPLQEAAAALLVVSASDFADFINFARSAK